MSPVGRALDDNIELARLVPTGELAELTTAIDTALGGELAIYDPHGHRLAGAASAGVPAHDVHHAGERIAVLAASGPRADAAVALGTSTLDLLLHHAHARELAATTHDEAMRLTFAELTEQNARLSRAVERLEELDRLKSNFLATMSHELRTPLTSVIGYAEMMAEGLAGPINPEQREYLATILGKADQLLGLITSVLDVSALETGAVVLERSALSVAELVASEVATVAPHAGRRGIAIHLDAEGDSTIVGDRRKIRQVVSSLLSNAVKFSPDRGRVAVTVQLGSLEPHTPTPGSAVRLVVSDSGIGISRDQVAKIFEPFFQVDSSSTRAHGGTGVGLTLAKAYVEAHGGRIWVDTVPGEGATFTVTFPLSVAASEAR